MNKEHQQEWLNTIKHNKIVQAMMQDNQAISDETLIANFRVLDKFLDVYHECDINQPCVQHIKGFQYKIRWEEPRIQLYTEKCPHSQSNEADQKIAKNYLFYDFGDNNLGINIKKDWNTTYDPSRVELTRQLIMFVHNMMNKSPDQGLNKGFYIYGEPGVGKTFFTIAAGNALANNGYQVAFINVSNLAQQLKVNFEENNNYYTVLRNLQSCDVLFLDDIGGEMMSRWFRDEIMFNLLNYRLNCKKPTFFTSNFSINTLFKLYCNVAGEDPNITKIKAKRLIERIQALSKDFELGGQSLRR